VKADEAAVRKILSNVPGICALNYAANDDGTARVTLETRQVQNEQIFLAFSQAGCPILQMTSGKASLEDIFLELTGDTAATRKEDENRDSHSET
ncbi:MAG: ABC transporter, partial [Oscillospiraceae bacterium]|nr:ABC transporter [Oscillospiraceae bacterium]